MFSVRPSVRPLSVNSSSGRDVSVLSGLILMKLATNIHHVSGQCRKYIQGQRSRSYRGQLHYSVVLNGPSACDDLYYYDDACYYCV